MSSEIILVIDGNREAAVFFVTQAFPYLGYQGTATHSTEEALLLLRQQTFSLLLLDLQTPALGGLEFLRRIRSENILTPAILLTSSHSDSLPVEVLRLGVYGYLTRPIDTGELGQAIDRALTESRLREETSHLIAEYQQQSSWLAGLPEALQSIISGLDLDEVLLHTVEAGVRLMEAEEGFLTLVDADSGRLHLRAAKTTTETLVRALNLPEEDPLVAQVLRDGLSVRISQPDPLPPILAGTGSLARSLIHAPLMSKGRPLGVLTVINKQKGGAFTEREEAWLTSLAKIAAITIENASAYEQLQNEIERRKRVEQALRESEERYALAVLGADDGLWDWNLTSNQVYFSPRWKSLLGYRDDEIGGSLDEWLKRVHPEDLPKVQAELAAHIKAQTARFQCEHRVLHKNGHYRWLLSRGLATYDENGMATRLCGAFTDIDDRKNAEQRLMHDALYDSMTSLPNRTLFLQRLQYALDRTRREAVYLFAVLFLDLDRFKDINDSLGHIVGDELLAATARRLEAGLRRTDMVARFGGDEFVILLDGIPDVHIATRVANDILQKLSRPFKFKEHEVFISASIGIVLSNPSYKQPDEVIRDADIAMYVAKERGKARFEIFEPAMRQQLIEHLKLEMNLRQAIDRQELSVYYQPIANLQTGQLAGFEALVRWQHPEYGLLKAADFVALAEEIGLISKIDLWVLQRACQEMSAWGQAFPQKLPLFISVNVSGKQITKSEFITAMKSVIEQCGTDIPQIRVEIAESSVIANDPAMMWSFTQLKEMGVRIQIDDFGIGYSSLGYLHQYSVHGLKINYAFVEHLGGIGSQPEIVRTILKLASELDMETTAEGIENQQQYNQLRELGCEFGQGYHISQPLDRDGVLDLLNKVQSGELPWNTPGDAG